MPSRPTILLIALFWLGMATWFTVREVVPRWLLEEAPPYHLDLTDEVSNSSITWTVWVQNKIVGVGGTEVIRREDRLFELRGDFRLDRPVLPLVDVRRLSCRYRVTRDGKLVWASFKSKIRLLPGSDLELEGEVRGRVIDGKFYPRLFIFGEEQKLPGVDAVSLPRNGNILNPMLPLNRVSGLRAGKRWSEPLLDPLGDIKGWAGGKVRMSELHAEVVLDTLTWHGEPMLCWKIEYREPVARKVVARTWVRRRDDLVLQQEANHEGVKLVLVRERSQ